MYATSKGQAISVAFKSVDLISEIQAKPSWHNHDEFGQESRLWFVHCIIKSKPYMTYCSAETIETKSEKVCNVSSKSPQVFWQLLIYIGTAVPARYILE